MTHTHQPRTPRRPRRRLDARASRLLTLDAGTWLSCDDCFDLVDQVAEDLVLRGTDPGPAFRDHLLGCPACHDEAQTLVDLLAEEAGHDRAAALRRLELALAR